MQRVLTGLIKLTAELRAGPERRPAVHRFRALALLFFLLLQSVQAQSDHRDAPAHRVDGSFVKEWLVLGPFPSRVLETDFLANAGGEASVRPKEGDTVTTSDGTQRTWTRLRSDSDIVNLEKIFGIQTWAVAYAYCELSSDRPMETDLRPPLGPSLLWLNGRLTGAGAVLSGGGNVPPARPIQLKAGRNPCLLKLPIGATEWTFSMQPLPPGRATVELLASDPEGRPIPGAVVQFYDQGEPVWRLETGASGQAEVCLYPLAKAYDVRVTSEEKGAWLFDVALRPGERRQLNLALTKAVSLSGRVLAMDASPQNAIVVQALRDPGSSLGAGSSRLAPETNGLGESMHPLLVTSAQSLLPKPPFSETVLSDTNGYFQFVNLRPGAYRLRGHGPDGYVYPAGRPDAASAPPILVEPGRANEPVQFMFAAAKKGDWRRFTITKGLVELSPRSVHQTPDGLLWIGSDGGGLQSYDGTEFKIFQPPQIPGHEVETINHDAEGAVWIGTSSGISRSAGGPFQIEPFGDTLPRNYINNIVPDPGGAVWFGTSSGLCRYENGQWSNWRVQDGLPSNSLVGLMRAKDGALWMGSPAGIARLENGTISVLLAGSGFSMMNIRRIYEARDGAIWFCSSELYRGGVHRFHGGELRRLGVEEGLADENVFDIVETSDGDFWFATGKGLSRFNGETVVNYTTHDGLSNEWVRDIFVDEDDVLWLANGWGVSRFDPNGFINFSKPDGLIAHQVEEASVFALEPDREGGFWVGTQWGGVHRLNAQGRHPAPALFYTKEGYVRAIHRAADGKFWFGTSGGIYQLKENSLAQVVERNWVIALASDNQGRLWFGHGWNGGGLSRHDPATGAEAVFMRAQGLPDDHVWCLQRDPAGGVWVGTGGGLVHAEGDKLEVWNERLGIPGAAVFHLRREEPDTLWIGTTRGLHRVEGTNRVSITATNGLPDEHVWSSARTPDGIIWIGTQTHGLIGYDGKAMTVLDQRDGLQGNTVFTLEPDGDDALWVGFLDGGMTRYRKSQSRPSIRLLEVQLEDRTLPQGSPLPQTEIGHLVRIQYKEIDLKTHPEKRQFCYRLSTAAGQTVLAGVTKDRSFEWIPTAGGIYDFEVQAIDRGLNYSDPARLTFRATVPWHANAWITVPGGSAVVGLLVWAVIARFLYIRKRREADRFWERSRIARDLHDHLGAGLTHVALLGDFVRRQSGQPGPAQAALATQLIESTHELSRTMAEVIWATDPAKDTIRSFISFVSIHAEKFFAGNPLRLRLDFPAQLPNLLLPAQLRHSLFLVAKEALHNVAKHAEASEVRIKLELIDFQLYLSIEDDGRGFQPAARSGQGHGLANMEKRMRDMGGQLVIESTVGGGTKVHARVPLPKR